MPKYTVCLAVYAEKYVTVEANTEDEAKEKAEASDENSFSLCNSCSNEFELVNCSGEAVAVELEEEIEEDGD